MVPGIHIVILLICWGHLTAQPVVFVNDPDLLNYITGFADYADCAVDMNGDYLDDVVRIGGKGMYIDYQQKDGTFSQAFFNIPIRVLPTWSICAGDINDDGLNDLLFASSTQVSFFKSKNGGKSYVENVMPVSIASQRSTMADINNDGWLDAFVCNDTARSIPFRNDGQGNMVPDISLIETSNTPGSYSAIWTDYDNDQDIDLYLTKCKAGAPPTDTARVNLMYRNNQDGTFTEVAASLNLNDNAQSWSTSFEDFDNDGDMDAFIVNHDFQNRLLRNNNDGTFTDVIHGSGIDLNDLGAFENSTGDFNNDGYVDIFSDLAQRLYLGNGDMTFTGQTIPVTPGAICDLNNDGFLDIVMRGRPWINQSNTNHWLKIQTFGIEGNRNGLGSRIEIYGEWGIQVREVRSGQSYSPMSSLNTHFGLGGSTYIDSIIVKWPSGITTILKNLTADTNYLIPEAECVASPLILSQQTDTSICEGSFLILTAPQGYSSYAWNNHLNEHEILVDEEGIYFVVAVDSSGCTGISNSIQVNFIEEFDPEIFATFGNHICEGDSLVLHATHGTNHQWSNGITGQSSITITESGTYSVAVESACSDDPLVSQPFTVIVIPNPAPQISGITIASGDSVLLIAEGENLLWYDRPSGGIPIGTGPAFQTSTLFSDTTFYVESRIAMPGEIQSGGKADTAGSGGLPAQVGYLLFTAWDYFELKSVDVYLPPGAPEGVRFLQLFDETIPGLVYSKQFMVHTGWNTLELNWNIPVGKFSLRSPQGNMYRNTGDLQYPFALGTVGEITSSSFGDDYYYFFYNWKIESTGFECISERVPFEVIVTGTDDQNNNAGWNIFPNPASTQVSIRNENFHDSKLAIIDMTGRVILKLNRIENNTTHIALQDIASGIYIIQLINKDGNVKNYKLVVE